MDNAGKALADFLNSEYPGQKILFVCGTGNNGGDGFCAAGKMDSSKVSVALLKKPSEIRSKEAWDCYSALECPIIDYSKVTLDDYEVIVDCALGTGMSGKIREPYLGFIKDISKSKAKVVSADVPSGLGGNDAVRPSATVTFHDVKEGMTPDNCGRIVIADIGIPAEAVDCLGPGDMLRYPVPRKDSHKGENGRLMIIGGGPYYGAPAMAALGALRTGTDLVRLFIPESIYGIVASYSPVPMITTLPGDHLTLDSVGMLLEESENYDAVLIGPGLGTSDDTMNAVRSFVTRCTKPMVVDADGITAVSSMELNDRTILTPHKAEFRRLGGSCCVMEMSEHISATILLKGPTDEISDGRRTRLNRTGTPAMTGAGTGDVLAGCVSGLLSKGMTTFDAACLGAYICGLAGEKAAETKSYGTMATDIIECIPIVLGEHLS